MENEEKSSNNNYVGLIEKMDEFKDFEQKASNIAGITSGLASAGLAAYGGMSGNPDLEYAGCFLGMASAGYLLRNVQDMISEDYFIKNKLSSNSEDEESD